MGNNFSGLYKKGCLQFSPRDFIAYCEGMLSPELNNKIETHCANCLWCWEDLIKWGKIVRKEISPSEDDAILLAMENHLSKTFQELKKEFIAQSSKEPLSISVHKASVKITAHYQDMRNRFIQDFWPGQVTLFYMLGRELYREQAVNRRDLDSAFQSWLHTYLHAHQFSKKDLMDLSLDLEIEARSLVPEEFRINPFLHIIIVILFFAIAFILILLSDVSFSNRFVGIAIITALLFGVLQGIKEIRKQQLIYKELIAFIQFEQDNLTR